VQGWTPACPPGYQATRRRSEGGETGFPHAPPRGGFGRRGAVAPRLYAHPGNNPPAGRVWEGFALPRIGIFILALCGAAAWMTEVNIRGNRVSPPAVSLSNRTPACGGASRSQQRLGNGETGFPHPPPSGDELEGCSPPRNKLGKPGFPTPLLLGKGWEGATLPGTSMLILVSCGCAAQAPAVSEQKNPTSP